MPNVARRKRLERKGRHAGAAPPSGDIFGPACVDDEEVRIRVGLDQSIEQLFGRAVDPVDVLEQEDDRRGAATRRQERGQQVARAQADQNAVEARKRGFRRVKTEQIEQQAKILGAAQLQCAQPRVDLARDPGWIVLPDAEGVAHHLEEWQERNLLTVGCAMSGKDEGFVVL